MRAAAQQVIQSSKEDLIRFQNVGDMILSMMKKNPVVSAKIANGDSVSSIWKRALAGEPLLCGNFSKIFIAALRTVGYSAREIRFFNHYTSHAGVEVYSPQHRKWIYYDSNYNGYAVDAANRPLSIADLRGRFKSGQPFTAVGNPNLRIDATPFESDSQQYPSSLNNFPYFVYVLNNDFSYFEEGKRFGRLNGAYPFLINLPGGIRTALDRVFGGRKKVFLGKMPIHPTAAKALFVYLAAVCAACCFRLF